MFLTRRITQAEYFDSERPISEQKEFYRALNQVNRFFAFADPFERLLPPLLGENACTSLSLLDLGAGDGALGQELTRWASRRGWQWRVTNLDLSPAALSFGDGAAKVAGSALALPFKNNSFDVVIGSQMAHHLQDAQVVKHLQEAWRVARRAVFISDVHRNAGLYFAVWLACQFGRFPRTFREDAVLSIKRGWRLAELDALARAAGLPDSRVQLLFGARIILSALKPG